MLDLLISNVNLLSGIHLNKSRWISLLMDKIIVAISISNSMTT
jgi:hypothetical protein